MRRNEKLKKTVLVSAAALLAASCVPPGAEQGGGGSAFSAMLPFVAIFLLFYFLIIRPQQKQGRERKKMLAEIKRGDSVVTAGGIRGKVVDADGDDLTVEIAKGTNVRMVRSGISEKTGPAASEDGKSKGSS